MTINGTVVRVKTALTALRNNWSTLDADRVEQYLDRMFVEISRVEYLLRSLRPSWVSEHVHLRACSTRRLLLEIAPVVTTAALERGVLVEINAEHDLWINADCRALYQALLNLVTNAMDAVAQTQGRVTLCARRLGSGLIALEVADDGEGIATNDLEIIRRPSHPTRPRGTGLGLPIVQRLAFAMGGELVVDSSPGVGTTLRIVLHEASPAA